MTPPAPIDPPEREDPRRTAQLARSTARLAAVQALYQMEVGEAGRDEVVREYFAHRDGAEIEGAQYRSADPELFRWLVTMAVDRQRDVDRMVDSALVERWPLGRVDPTLRALFRAAGVELTDGSTPPKVVIAEFVDVAKAFFPDGREPGFVNAVLDHVARHVRPEAFETS